MERGFLSRAGQLQAIVHDSLETMKTLSIVVIGKDEEQHIGACLRSVLAAAAAAGGAEVVYVDSVSTDRTVEIARALGVRVFSLRPEWRLSPAAGRYIGFHHTCGELVMFVDGDTVIEGDWLRNAAPCFDRAEVAGVAGHLDDLDEQGRTLPFVGERNTEVEARHTLRGIALYRRAALKQVGTFNPHLRCEEESELGLRLRQAGWRLLQLPFAMGCHQRGSTTLKSVWRAWRLGRVSGVGLTWRYACRAGLGWAFCFERLRPAINFGLTWLALSPGLVLAALGQLRLAAPFGVAWLAWMLAVALKKRSLMGPVNYLAIHSVVLLGLAAGLFFKRLPAPDDYPLNAKEQTETTSGKPAHAAKPFRLSGVAQSQSPS